MLDIFNIILAICKKNAINNFSMPIALFAPRISYSFIPRSPRKSFLPHRGPGPVSCPAFSLQSLGCIWLTLKRSTLMGACVHAYTRRHINFTMAPIRIWPHGYISISDGAPACLSHLPCLPFIPNPFRSAPEQLVPVVFRIDGAQPDPAIVSVANFSRV